MKEVNKILLIKLRHHGDVLLVTPLIEACRFFFPLAKIDVLVYEECLTLLKYHKQVNELLSVNRAWKKENFFKRMKAEISLLKKIRQNSYDLIFNLTEGDRGALYTAFSKAACKVGIDPENKGLLGKKFLFTHLVNPNVGFKHAVEMNLDFLRKINLFPPQDKREASLIYTSQDHEHIKQYYKEKTVLIHPVSRWMFKAVLPKTIKEVLVRLLQEGYKVIITGSNDPEEIKYNQEVLKGIDSSFVTDLSGKLTILELAALIDLCDAIITVDSLPMHIAAIYKKPQVAIFGPTSWVKWAPWRNPYAKIVTLGLPCQPCYKAGCQNSKKSDCLVTLPAKAILDAFFSVTSENLGQDNELLHLGFP